MPRYIIFRHGSNTDNQPMTQLMALGTYVSEKRLNYAEQLDVIAELHGESHYYHCWNNQYLSLLAWSLCTRVEQQAALEGDDDVQRYEEARQHAREGRP